MDLVNAERGDLAIFSDGSQALINDKYRTISGRYCIVFDGEVTGWVNMRKSKDWYYEKDGSFVATGDDSPHLDIVKVVRND